MSEVSQHDEDALGRAYDGRLLVRLWPYIRPYRRQVFATLGLFFPIFLLELAPAWVVKVGLDLIVGGRLSESQAALRPDAIE